VTATSGSIAELYRQICFTLDMRLRSSSKAVLTKVIRLSVMELVQKKMKPVLIIDEASLIRLDVFAEFIPSRSSKGTRNRCFRSYLLDRTT